jgi:NTP pyrophosphatase (non-canonical NTP hydrolase)
MSEPIWDFVSAMDLHLDGNVAAMYQAQPLAQHWGRVAKIGEELGEAIEALIGCTGQNPRKGFSKEWDDLYGELADVVMTAILALQHFTKDADATRQIIEDKSQFIYRRMVDWELLHVPAPSSSAPTPERELHLKRRSE